MEMCARWRLLDGTTTMIDGATVRGCLAVLVAQAKMLGAVVLASAAKVIYS